MTWITKPKQLSLTRQTPHTSGVTGVVGRSPGFSTISFGPLDLYGAAARCSHLYAINPALATPESHMIGALIEQYVDDVASDFAVLASAATFKDFVKSYFVGTVAAGLAYLAMIDDGYVWGDHYENVGGGNSGVAKSPDFVFTRNGDVALMESKGTRSARLSAFDGTVESGYVDQVNPHLGYTVGGGIATHGFCIGSWLTSPTKAELVVHHTASPVSGGAGASGSQPALALAAIQRQNYATAFSLAHSVAVGEQFRTPGTATSDVPFVRIGWRGRVWVTSLNLSAWQWWWDDFLFFPDNDPDLWEIYAPKSAPPFFAIEETIAKAALARFCRSEPGTGDDIRIEPLSRDLRFAGLSGEQPQSGAAFPDGLAVIRGEFKIFGRARWSPTRAEYRELR